ncbi:hypothetical protein CSE16_00670 [Solibacillus sp. R5-41]|nr:hypothetical protein CSE16_00670 [Solibacillus sp. R5-41]
MYLKLDARQVKSIKKMHKAYLSLLIKSHENMSIHNICLEADVTRPTFYKFYKDPMELRLHLHETLLQDLKACLKISHPKEMADFGPEELPENMLGLFEHILENQLAYEVLLVNKPDGFFIKAFKEILLQYIEDGIATTKFLPKDIRAEKMFIFHYVVGAYIESITWWLQNNCKQDTSYMALKLLELSLHGPYKIEIEWKK